MNEVSDVRSMILLCLVRMAAYLSTLGRRWIYFRLIGYYESIGTAVANRREFVLI